MNFLSHYYFDKDTANCYFVLGTVLPDLLKNADKSLVLHPEKLKHTNSDVASMIAGWNKHLEVDRYFHSSPFFSQHSHQLKLELLPVIQGSPVKPFFLGHIALELILDNLLLTTHKLSADSFYEQLAACDDIVIREFLEFSRMKEPSVFFDYFEVFKQERYLHTYTETQKIAYALKRICMRVWPHPFTREHEANMDAVLLHYRKSMLNDFMCVFDYVQSKLTQ